MDISNLAAEETSFLHLRDAAGDLLFEGGDPAKPVGIRLYGPGSGTYARAVQDRQNRLIARIKKKARQPDPTPEETAAENAQFLAAITHSFQHLECGELQGAELFKAVYANPQVGYIAEQAIKHAQEWANFAKASSTS